jgi:hypothetical protein
MGREAVTAKGRFWVLRDLHERAGRCAAIHPAVEGIEQIDPLWTPRTVRAADAGAAVVCARGHVETHEGIDARLAEFLNHAPVIGSAVKRAYRVVRHVLLEDQLTAARSVSRQVRIGRIHQR